LTVRGGASEEGEEACEDEGDVFGVGILDKVGLLVTSPFHFLTIDLAFKETVVVLCDLNFPTVLPISVFY
jgi:hypothetical protein